MDYFFSKGRGLKFKSISCLIACIFELFVAFLRILGVRTV